jgi:hypothetical protein
MPSNWGTNGPVRFPIGSGRTQARKRRGDAESERRRTSVSGVERRWGPDGELLVGEKFKDFRAEFAADVDAEIFFPMKGDEEPFRQFAYQLQEVVRQ